MTSETILPWLGYIVVGSPLVLLTILGLPLLVGYRLREETQAQLTKTSVVLGLIAACTIVAIMVVTGIREVPVEFGNWVIIEQEHFHFHIKFVFDRLSVPFTILSFVLCGTVGAFATAYLHRESGFQRFFFLYAMFLLGMIFSSLAGTIETLFVGWELVGLSSALLVAYSHERPGPVRNGHRVWATYRIADAAFLLAALAMHQLTGAGEFDRLMGAGTWPDGVAAIQSWQALAVGSLLLLAAAGKSAMIPFSGWLPRAMEGPTPSSAIFYGALSVHLGTYLLLRVSPVLEASFTLRLMVIGIGLASAILGALASRVQCDVKNALAFASLTQVGIITVEIGLGLHYIALIHMIGHATLRTLQLLRAPSALRDQHMHENAAGIRFSGDHLLPRSTPSPFSLMLYRFALHRGYLDALLDDGIVRPVTGVLHWFDSLERSWMRFLSGETQLASERVSPFSDSLEDVA